MLVNKKVPELPGAPPAHLPKRTMIKDIVGAVRTTSYDLPGEPHVYGLPGGKDAVGSGGVISTWVTATPSKPTESQRSFIASNKAALKEGHISSKSQRAYALEHPDIRFKQDMGHKHGSAAEQPFLGPFGAATEGQNVPIRNLIEASYTEWDDDKNDYPDLTAVQKKHRLKPPKSTKASKGHDVRTNAPPEAKTPFKMKRFAAVKSRVQLPASKSSSEADGGAASPAPAVEPAVPETSD